MANLVKLSVLRQCLRQAMQKNAQRTLSTLSIKLNKSTEKLKIKSEFGQLSNPIARRNKTLLTKKILYTKDELKEKVMAISKKHEKIDESKFKPVFGFILKRGYAEKPAISYNNAKERIMLVLKLYDKIDPDKLTLESHFINDLGLDSLDHVEIIMAIEDEFFLEILDVDAEKLLRPIDIVEYLATKEECYKEFEHVGDSLKKEID